VLIIDNLLFSVSLTLAAPVRYSCSIRVILQKTTDLFSANGVITL